MCLFFSCLLSASYNDYLHEGNHFFASVDSTNIEQAFTTMLHQASLVAQRVKCLPAMRETWIRSLGWEDLLEKEKATHSGTLA